MKNVLEESGGLHIKYHSSPKYYSQLVVSLAKILDTKLRRCQTTNFMHSIWMIEISRYMVGDTFILHYSCHLKIIFIQATFFISQIIKGRYIIREVRFCNFLVDAIFVLK